ncbi:MAG: HlyD family efflux transporter periplasmic adaptor subunit [Planctomycetaceae bacterium]|nr:HlyD family efflux transporter periplasmic adaptor subunit [Planctomycetaceae bacterium]
MISRNDMIRLADPKPTRMLGPAAYNESILPSLQLTRSSRFARRIGRTLLVLLVLSFLLAVFAPWQQSVSGEGNVIAFAPKERRQTIEAPVKGRLVRWGDNVFENAHLRAGDLIAEIRDVDPLLMNRLQEQLVASKTQVEAAEQLLNANRRSLDAAHTVVHSFESQVAAYTAVRQQVVASAEAAVAGAQNKVDAERRQLDEDQANLSQAKADYDRQKQLFEEEIVGSLKFQQAEQKFLAAKAKVEKAEAYVQSALNDLEMKQRDRDAKEQKASADIEYANASLRKATADAAKAESEVAKAQSELTKAGKSLLEMETKVARQDSQFVTAPFDGFLTQILPNQGSQILKEGDTLCVIVPDTSDRAVQVWLDGNDAPLVWSGRHVRLQFEGWPAVQFAGWPSVAVGTFGGTVVSVDATDNGKGKFRAIVRPDPSDKHVWPNERYLRQGVRTNAWVLLEQVPLWYEIWRNMNGFPPTVSGSGDDKEKTKTPKLPK